MVMALVVISVVGSTAGSTSAMPRKMSEAPPVEESGPDAGNDLDLPPVPPGPSANTRSVPPSKTFGFTIDDMSTYEKQSVCDPVAKPGTLELRAMLLRANPSTGDLGITRACNIGGPSEHKDGRAFDWKVSASSASQKAIADQVIAWMLTTDSHGHKYAVARRLGIMYIIWNHRVWSTYKADKGWRDYKGPDPHTSHVHFSLNHAGAEKRTTWWHPANTYGPVASRPIGTRQDFDADGFDDAFFYGVGSATDRIRWGAPSGTPAPTTSLTIGGNYWPVAGDFDGDGASDLIWYAPGSGQDYLWAGTPGARTFESSKVTINGNYQPVAGDFDGNGLDDIFWYGPGTLPDVIWWSTTSGRFASVATQTKVSGVYEPLIGDINGDGVDDVIWYGRYTLPDSVWLGTKGARQFKTQELAAKGAYRPFLGDFDGDGIDEVFWYGAGGSLGGVQWGAEKPLTGAFKAITIKGNYVPLVGDYNGDGADDITWYQPGTAPDSRWNGTPASHAFRPAADSIVGTYRAF